MDRKFFKVAVYPAAKQSVEDYAEAQGMTETAIASRLLEWFHRQDDVVKMMVLGNLPAAICPRAEEILIRQLVDEQVAGEEADQVWDGGKIDERPNESKPTSGPKRKKQA